MGGNAFGHESASRMTSEQLHKLERHCKEMLLGAGVFTKAQMFHYTANKATHGDLDLVVDYPDAWGPPYMRARELIYLDDVPLAEELAKNEHLGNFKFSKDAASRLAETRRMDLARETSFAAARAIGATAFNRNGHVASMRVPCHVVCDGFKEDEFFQVDVILVAPVEFDFYVFVTSYSSTILLLATALRRLSQSFTLHNNNFTIKHSPFLGQPGVEIVLCRDAKAFAVWLGLDYERWARHDFGSPEAMYTWITDVPEDSVVAEAWRRLARSKVREKSVAHIKKIPELDDFYVFLRTTKWAAPKPAIDGESQMERITESLALVSVGEHTAQHIPVKPEPVSEPIITVVPRLLPQPAMPEAIPRLPLEDIIVAKAPLVDLNDRAKAALQYFGKTAEWHDGVAQRVNKADEVWRSRLMHAYRKPYKAYGESKEAGSDHRGTAERAVGTKSVGDVGSAQHENVEAGAVDSSTMKQSDDNDQ